MTKPEQEDPQKAAFREAMREHGIEVPGPIRDDQIGRGNVIAKGESGRGDASYRYFPDDPPAGWWKNHITDDDVTTWCSVDWAELSPEDRERLRQRQEQMRREREQALKEQHRRAAAKAAKKLSIAKDAAGDHPYLRAKGIAPHGARVLGDKLVNPIYRDGELVSLQSINAAGEKRYEPKSTIEGGYNPIGDIEGVRRLVLAEGFSTAASIHEATGLAVVCTFDANNLLAVAREMRKRLPDAEIILAADDDHKIEGNPGVTRAKEAAAEVGGTVIVPEFGPGRRDEWTDFNDLAVHYGRDEVRRQFDAIAPDNSQAPHGIQLIAFEDLQLDTSRRYLIRGLFPDEGLIVVWGAPKSGKSFFMFDAMMHVALGWDWQGRKVAQGPVIYCCFEGQRGLRARAEAFRRANITSDDTGIPFYVVEQALDLVGDHRRLIAAIRAKLGGVIPVAVVVDTLNRSLIGSESHDEDMSAYIRACDTLKDAFGCAVLVVHHSGIEGSRPRGHTSLTAAVDAQLAVKKAANETITMKLELAKDGETGEQVAAELDVIEVGVDDDGEVITSCVLAPADTSAKTEIKLTKNQKLILEILKEAGPDGLELAVLNARARSKGLGGSRPAVLTEVRNALVRKGLIHNDGDVWHPTE